MGNWKTIVPETGTNLCTNPSFETNAAIWTENDSSGGLTPTRSSDDSKWGAYSLKMVQLGGNQNDYMRFRISSPDASTEYTVTAWVNVTVFTSAATSNRGLVALDSADASTLVSSDITAATTGWVKKEVTVTTTATPGNLDVRLYAPKGTLYWDGVQIEKLGYATTYIDGDQPDCEWNGAEHASTSTRKHWSLGGRVQDLADDLSFTVRRALGVGMPPVESGFRLQPGRDGSRYTFTRAGVRPFTLQGQIKGTSKSNLHSLRQSVIDALRPRKPRAGYPPVLRRLRYTGGGVDKEIDVLYDAGMEMDNGVEVLEQFAVRLIAPDPFWYAIGERADVLDTNDTVAVKYVAAREDGAWNGMGPPSSVGGSPVVRALVRVGDKTVYVGGTFTNWDGVANADYVAAWDGSSWSALGTGPTEPISALALSPDGTLYAGLSTSVGGVEAWDGSSWSTVGTLSDLVRDLVFGLDGTLYAATDAGEVQAWDGSSWSAVGSIGVVTNVWALAVAPDGTLYAGADSQVKAWDGSSWSNQGSAFDDAVRALLVAPDGTLYAGGLFTSISGGGNYTYVARWNGTDWLVLGNESDGNALSGGTQVRALALSPDGLLYVGGDFTAAGGLSAPDSLAVWDGSGWRQADVVLPGSPTIYAILIEEDDVYLGFDTAGNATGAGETTVSNSDDDSSSNLAPAYPVIEIERSGGTSAKLQSITNETTGAALWFDYDLLDGETLTIDLRPGRRRMVSSFFGERWKILPQSDITGWRLDEGDNQVMAYISESGSPTVTATIRWRPRYWSAD